MADFTFPTVDLGKNGVEYYAMGGITFEFDPKIGGSYSGVWVNLGPITNFTPNVNLETYDHYDPRPGTQVKDLSVVISKSLSFTFTVDEAHPFNLATLFMGSGYHQSGTTQSVTDESTTFGANNLAPLQHVPLSSPAPVVTDTGGTTTYTAGTDYEIVIGPDGKPYLFRDPDGAIPAGATVLVDYSYTEGDSTVITPLTADAIEGRVRITFRAGPVGKNWQYFHTIGSLKPTGTANFNVTEVSQFEFSYEALYDKDAVVSVGGTPQPAPFGYLMYDITL